MFHSFTDLPFELHLHVLGYLCLPSNIYLLSTCKKLAQLLSFLSIDEMVFVDNDSCNYKYFHCLKNIITGRDLLVYPMHVKSVTFCGIFNDATLHYLPRHIKHLTFDPTFNTLAMHTLPTQLEYLVFGYYFNGSIYRCLPNCITTLVFGKYFNQPIMDSIPKGVRYLKFGSLFNQPIGCSLSENIRYLIFGNNFNQTVAGLIPPSVQCLVFGKRFNKNLGENKLPNLCYLQFHESILASGQTLAQFFVKNVTHLRVTLCAKNEFNPCIQCETDRSSSYLNIFIHYSNHSPHKMNITHLINDVHGQFIDHTLFTCLTMDKLTCSLADYLNSYPNLNYELLLTTKCVPKTYCPTWISAPHLPLDKLIYYSRKIEI